MKLILTHDVDGLGSAGEVVEVKDGYGRNYLIPRGYATKWTKGGQKQVDQIAEARRKRAIASLEEANALRDALQSGGFDDRQDRGRERAPVRRRHQR